MSGSQGSPRIGRCKIRIRVQKVGTKQRFTTNVFVPISEGDFDSEKLTRKYPKLQLEIISTNMVKAYSRNQ